MGRPLDLRNPISIGAVSLISVARGVSYLGAYYSADNSPYILRDVGPSLPFVPVVVVGVVWVVLGLFLVASMFRWRWFRIAAGVTGGAYATWAVVYLGDMVAQFRWQSILSVTIYVGLFIITLTLAQDETTDGEARKI